MADTSFLGWPFFEERHRVLAVALEAWCEAHLPVDHDDVDAACQGLVALLGAGGWLRHSGAGVGERLDVRSLCLIRETLARHDGLADFSFAMQGLGMGAVSLFGSDQQREWLERTRAGTAIAGFMLTEPASGSDVASTATTAVRGQSGWVLNGEKTYISNGGIADVYVIIARTGEAAGAKGLSAFLLPSDVAGLSVVKRIEVMAPHPLAHLALQDVMLPEGALIGQAGDGFKIAMSVLDVFRSTVGAAALGFARRALDEALARTQSRRIGGAALSELQMVQGHLADMALQIDASALLIYRAAWTKDQGAVRISREAAMAKLYATEAAQKVIDMAVQLHGGDGVRHGFAVEALYREIRALRIYEGASDVQRVIIARSLSGMTYTREIQIEFNHCDPAGIVFYPRYFEMTNSVVENFFNDVVGRSFASMHARAQNGVPTVAIAAEFMAPSRLGDKVLFSLVITKLGRTSVTIVIEGRMGTALRIRAQLTLVWVDGMKPAVWPDEIRARLQSYMEDAA